MLTAPLLAMDELEALRRVTLRRRAHGRRRLGIQTSGPAPSAYRGQGMERVDVRPYQAGDEVRHMDWRITARSAHPALKLYREERRRALLLAVDKGPTMHFGTRGALKATTAAKTAVLLAYSALADQETLAAVIDDGTQAHTVAPARGLPHVIQLLKHVIAPLPPLNQARPAVNLETWLQACQRQAQRGAALMLISDFHHLTAAHGALLRQLAEHHDVTAWHIVDAGEEALPAAGRLRLYDPLAGRHYVIDSDNATLRARYAAHRQAHQAALEALFHRNGVRHFRIYTHADIDQQLAHAL